MASNRKDVELNLRVGTPGAENIGRLEEDLRSLAAEGADLGADLQGASAALVALRDAEKSAAAELRNAKQTLQDSRDAIRALRLETDAAGKGSDDYRAKLQSLQRAEFQAEKQVRTLKAAYDEARNAARLRASEEKALADQVRRGANAQADATKGLTNDLKGIAGQLTQIRAAAAAVLGGQVLGGMLGDVAKTADGFADLAARVKLATGEGQAFDQSFAGVFDIAQRTNIAVQSTGELFTRLAQAGKSLGLGVADALSLTETINQAVQLSGASAESSNAAITQLIQALQSGVLRGDEFNSVMEQSPRLAQALAAGLGTTTGELRKMAEAGRLTSQTVIAALQGQAAVVQSEFEKLPATIGRALTNLSSAWTQYVGEVDKANGISATAAGAINGLARNLGTVAELLYAAGKAAAAYKAVQLAQTLVGHAQATGAATAATAANTAATLANTAAKRENAAATVAAGESAAAGAGKLGAALGSLKMFALVAVLTNLRGIGTAIGEGIAKWAGYGKAIERVDATFKAEAETARASAASKAALAQQLQITADKALGLSAESRKLVDEFEGLRLKGESAAEALEKLEKNLRIGDIKGVQDAGAALDALGLKGQLTATQIRDSWTRALKDIDLGVFRTEAMAAFDGSEQGARRLAAALDGATREAIRRAGLDFDLISSGMGAAARSSLNDLDLIVSRLDALSAAGVDTGRALATSIGKAIETADSQAAIEAVKGQIEAVRKVLGDKIADGFLDQAKVKAQDLTDALESALPGVQSLREAYRQLGLQAPEDLSRIAATSKSAWDAIKQDGRASADTLAAAFGRYAQSALDASGAAGSASRVTTQELLKSEAAARGLAVEFDNAGRVIVRGALDSIAAVGKLGASLDRTTDSIRTQSKALDELYNRNRVGNDRITSNDPNRTADNFAKNADGSAAGTFTNTLPTDLAVRLRDTRGKGMTQAEIAAAIQQADNLVQYANTGPAGVNSFDFTKSVREIQNAATAAKDDQARQAAAGRQQAASAAAQNVNRSVTINIGGKSATIGVDSQQSSDALVGVLQALESSARSAA